MADIVDTILDEMIDAGYDYHTAVRMHREMMLNNADYRNMIYAEEQIDKDV